MQRLLHSNEWFSVLLCRGNKIKLFLCCVVVSSNVVLRNGRVGRKWNQFGLTQHSQPACGWPWQWNYFLRRCRCTQDCWGRLLLLLLCLGGGHSNERAQWFFFFTSLQHDTSYRTVMLFDYTWKKGWPARIVRRVYVLLHWGRLKCSLLLFCGVKKTTECNE